MKKTNWLFILFFALLPLFIADCKKDNTQPDDNQPQIKAPAVTTSVALSITAHSASLGGRVNSDGGAPVTARGLCWGTNPEPTVADNNSGGGTGTGSFTINLNDLYQGTTYYIRAYATNSVGTSYGEIRSFTTNYETTETSYFPIAVWLQDPLKTAAAYKSNGVNTFVGLWRAFDQPQYDALKNAQLKLICSQNEFGLSLNNDPLVLGWMHGDEPDNAQWNEATQKYDPCISPSIIINDYYSIKQKDPSRPVYLNLGQGVAYHNYVGRGACRNNLDTYKVSTDGYLKGCDIASFDIYPVNNTDATTKGNLWYVGFGIQNLITWSGNKPSWCWIETTQIRETSPRRPTPSEVRSEVWMALIHGAKGFGYFCHTFITGANDESKLLHDPEMIAAVKIINAQVTYLSSPLNSPTITGYATVNSSNTAVPVDIMTKNHNGVNHIFAIAMRSGETTATFTVASGSKAEVIGEGRAITITNGNFTDTFSSYGVHLYKITN